MKNQLDELFFSYCCCFNYFSLSALSCLYVKKTEINATLFGEASKLRGRSPSSHQTPSRGPIPMRGILGSQNVTLVG